MKAGDRSRETRKAREVEINKKEIKEREGGERCRERHKVKGVNTTSLPFFPEHTLKINIAILDLFPRLLKLTSIILSLCFFSVKKNFFFNL